MNRKPLTAFIKFARSRRLPALLAVLAGMLAAQSRMALPAAFEEMKLSIGRSAVLDRAADVARISISNPEVMDAVAITTREILVNAKSAGRSSMVIWSRTGERTMYAVTVEQDFEGVRRLLKETFPGEDIDVRADRDTLALVGRASMQVIADRAMALLAPLVKTVVNNLQVVPPGADKQIMLRVKIAEIDRTVATSFGINLLSTGALNTQGRTTTGQFAAGNPGDISGQTPGHAAGATSSFSLSDALNIFAFRPDLNLGVVIRDLQTRGLLQILAEPNLVATNGKEASFLVGGEFPVPIVQGGQNAGAVTIQFREFGIRLSFLPVITGHNTIKMHVKPEVSTIDLANAVVFSGFTIPALATRRIETDVELGEGQSFVIAGLLDNRVTENLSKVPGLANIPILGALFKSRSENKSKSELVVMVTPESIYPLAPGDKKPIPVMPNPFLPASAPTAVVAEVPTESAQTAQPALGSAPGPGSTTEPSVTEGRPTEAAPVATASIPENSPPGKDEKLAADPATSPAETSPLPTPDPSEAAPTAVPRGPEDPAPGKEERTTNGSSAHSSRDARSR